MVEEEVRLMLRLWAPEGAEMPLAVWEDGK